MTESKRRAVREPASYRSQRGTDGWLGWPVRTKEIHARWTAPARQFDWSCVRYLRLGAMMPEDGLERLRRHDAILLGAVGYPGVPDHVSLWGLLIPIRRAFHQYVNLRPIRVFEGLPSPVRGATA